MTDLGPNQLAWLREHVSAFKPAEKQAGDARRHSEEVERKLKGNPMDYPGSDESFEALVWGRAR
jgi:hypothetical protein